MAVAVPARCVLSSPLLSGGYSDSYPCIKQRSASCSANSRLLLVSTLLRLMGTVVSIQENLMMPPFSWTFEVSGDRHAPKYD
jgi:hypothetical protein